MSETYALISKNRNHSTTDLHLYLIPLALESYLTPDFHDFLSSIETFTIEIEGTTRDLDPKRMGEPLYVGARDGYIHFCKKLSSYMFDHLDSVKTVKIVAPKSGPLGFDYYAPLAFTANQMPNLSFLSLELVCISVELAAFFAAHKTSLEEIRFRDCYGAFEFQDSIPKSGMCSWRHLFDHMSDAQPESLGRLEITPWQVPFWADTTQDRSTWSAIDLRYGEGDDALEAYEILDKNPERPVFAYGSLGYEDGLYVRI
ncbi:uncharacterized protein BDZ99DRAFT_213925 [Mytilinidion resinicola]|uniref:Uncharacterized protein n=1 Tax=Mytilinidion resinicola TaxID=574789 RepID=A0A6A6Y0R7_9PEZI|nr:uncharacterized protein BDZ99DRAFT_213925 [Mytilinidion resinicola]KAF2801825.1 hypothetical protein BDZ99DRAFT_213925 [Mytilinidion resinicola]